MRILPKWLAPYVFSLVLSGGMSCLVTGVASAATVGIVPGFFGIWMMAWATSWPIAFPAALLFSPIARRIVGRLTVE